MITEEIKVNNYATYKRYLENLVGKEVLENLIEQVGGDEALMNASFGMSVDSGCAYEGSLIENTLNIAKIACGINETLPESIKCQKSDIYMVSLLQHIAKVVMYVENDDDWVRSKRGILYKFNDMEDGMTFKCGERSVLMLINAGLTNITPQQYEALRIVDKVKDNMESAIYASCSLSMIIRQANEIVSMINKNK